MTFCTPDCYKCSKFKNGPDRIGGTASCEVFTNGVPREIFFAGHDCPAYKDRNSDRNLGLVLANVINKYGRNEDYFIPAMEWSKNNMIVAFGEYQYCKNKIIISRLLKDVSENALESVVYHEYSHQVYKDEDENHKHLAATVPDYDKLNIELKNYLDNYNDWTQAETNDLKLDSSVETLFCKIHFIPVETDSYYKKLGTFDHYLTGFLDAAPANFAKKYPQVIFTVEYNKEIYIVGWAKDVLVYGEDKHIDFSDTGLDIEAFNYQFKCLTDDIRILFESDLMNIGSLKDMPAGYKKNGCCNLSDFTGKNADIILENINQFDCSFYSVGLLNSSIDCKAPIFDIDDYDDVSRFISFAEKEKDLFRKIWILNRACCDYVEPEIYCMRAQTFEELNLFDCAVEDYLRAISAGLKDDGVNKHIESLIAAHNKFNEI